ncbi:hypothetical protein GF327_04290 [Candidatus Woesearchaeota archaeon]|nr:hypothetical protein [Candidatus Woesearchaeota archaeon]
MKYQRFIKYVVYISILLIILSLIGCEKRIKEPINNFKGNEENKMDNQYMDLDFREIAEKSHIWTDYNVEAKGVLFKDNILYIKLLNENNEIPIEKVTIYNKKTNGFDNADTIVKIDKIIFAPNSEIVLEVPLRTVPYKFIIRNSENSEWVVGAINDRGDWSE